MTRQKGRPATPRRRSGAVGAPYVSTGHLPPAERVRALVAEAYERFKSNRDGENSKV